MSRPKLHTVTLEQFKVQCLAQRHLASKLQRVEQAAYEDRKKNKNTEILCIQKTCHVYIPIILWTKSNDVRTVGQKACV